MVSGNCFQHSAGQSPGVAAGWSNNKGPSPCGCRSRALFISSADKLIRNAAASKLRPIGAKNPERRCALQPSAWLATAVEANPASEIRVGIWHQVHLTSLSKIEANLEIWFSDRAKKIGPIGHGQTCSKVKGNDFFDRGQQRPQRSVGRGTGHLDRSSKLVGTGCYGRHTLKLLLSCSWA